MKYVFLVLFSSFLCCMHDNQDRVEVAIEQGKITITETHNQNNQAPIPQAQSRTCLTKRKLAALAGATSIIVAGGITLAIKMTQEKSS